MHRLAFALPAALLTSCGTIFNGGPFMVPVNSSPPGATVLYRNVPVGTTPCQVAMHPGDTELRVTMTGRNSASVEVPTSLNWWSVANAVFLLPGIIIGDTVDFATGCWQIVDTTPIHVMLVQSYTPRTNVAVSRTPTPGQAAPVLGNALVLSSRSKLHGRVVTVERIEGMIVTVRAVDTGETDSIVVPFNDDVAAAKSVLDAKAQLPLKCMYQ